MVNNSGITGPFAPSEWLTRQDYRDVFEVNTFGMAEVTSTFLPLVKRARGRIVNVSSVYGRFAFSGVPAYAMSKFAVEAYSDTLRYCYIFCSPFTVDLRVTKVVHTNTYQDAQALIMTHQK